MSRLTRGPALFLCLILLSTSLRSVAQNSAPHPPEAAGENPPVRHVHIFQHGVPWKDAGGPIGFAAPAGAHLSYFGGPVISNAHVVEVLYGSGSYNSQVAGST